MPNIKSAKKRVLIGANRNAANRATKTALKTKVKKYETAVEHGDPVASDMFKEAVRSIDKAAGKGVLHKNTAARKKSKLARLQNKAN